jgi:hypothetical protein
VFVRAITNNLYSARSNCQKNVCLCLFVQDTMTYYITENVDREGLQKKYINDDIGKQPTIIV